MTAAATTGAPGPSAPVPHAPRRARAVREALAAAVVLVAGVAVGAGWALLLGRLSAIADGNEATSAADVAMALVQLVPAVLTPVAVRWRPGPRPVLRVAVVLAATLPASLVALGTGMLLGAGAPQAPGVLLVWPAGSSLLLVVVTAVRGHPEP